MPTEIRMPRLVDSMTHGAIIAWRKREGETVAAGEVIAEIEVDKTTVDLMAPDAGTLTRIEVPADSEKVEVGTVLAILEPIASPVHSVITEPAPPAFKPAALGHGCADQPAESDAHIASASREPKAPVPRVEVDASPMARSMAFQAGVDISSIHGSGPSGRVLQVDILAALGLSQTPNGVRSSASVALSSREITHTSSSYDEIPHSRVRQVTAQRLSDSKRTIPHFYLEVNCRVDALLQLRAELQSERSDDVKLSVNDFAARAAALALRNVPDANASWTQTAIRRYPCVDLAIAVATESGLVAPIVRNADVKSLVELAVEIRDLVKRACEGRLRLEELDGGTFTISNLGMYGVDSLFAIINPPQAGILGLGKAKPRPVVVDGSVVVATMMTCTLSADHRVLDGATGARLLSTFKSLIEEPSLLTGPSKAMAPETSVTIGPEVNSRVRH